MMQILQGVSLGLKRVLRKAVGQVVLGSLVVVVAAVEAVQLYLAVAEKWRSIRWPAEPALARALDQCADL